MEPISASGVAGHWGFSNWFPMSEPKQDPRQLVQAQTEFSVQFLRERTGITEAQARDLIEMLGNDPNSLLREARILRRK
ncbi:MAG: hypothetical protein EOQ60_01630 [Mesorhizobium sp.]|nr:hypothetical protein EOA91_14990 [Mesorhizobium sp. M1A.F.Ca.IN.022.04.1.1]RWG37204.1 MAG: hypothetical protein EOQ60_01630 [Mesorhizobium sp.]